MSNSLRKIYEYRSGNTGKMYDLDYDEYIDDINKKIVIKAKLEIDLTSKSNVNKINKSLLKEKSPLLTELQDMNRGHQQDLKEQKCTKRYSEIDYEQVNKKDTN